MSIRETLENDKDVDTSTILHLANPRRELNGIITNPHLIQLTKAYFEGLFQYPNHIFNVATGMWLVCDNTQPFTCPQIFGTIPGVKNSNEILNAFMELVASVNDIN